MDFELMFYLLLAFIVGRISTMKVYIGHDKKKYEAADFGIQLR